MAALAGLRQHGALSPLQLPWAAFTLGQAADGWLPPLLPPAGFLGGEGLDRPSGPARLVPGKQQSPAHVPLPCTAASPTTAERRAICADARALRRHSTLRDSADGADPPAAESAFEFGSWNHGDGHPLNRPPLPQPAAHLGVC
jgi:hypothetical protein